MEPLGRISYVCDGDCQLQSTEPAPGVVVTSEASPQSTGRRRGRSAKSAMTAVKRLARK